MKKSSTSNFEHRTSSIVNIKTTTHAPKNFTYASILRRAWGLVFFFLSTLPAWAQGTETTETLYKVESIEVIGSSRLTGEQIYGHLRINDQTLMSDEWLESSRRKILGMALFKNLFFSLRKGSKPGYAKLVVSAVDDDTVISNLAVAGEFGLSLVKPSPDIGDDSVFRSYKFGLVARNILKRAHRGALLAEIATDGSLAQASLGYGLPRFAHEAIQFDTAILVVDPSKNYQDTEAFGMKAQALWTRQRGGVDLTYGLAWYSNRHERYNLENWPLLVSGPKFGLLRETRLQSFLPQGGYKAEFAAIPSLVNRKQTTIEAELQRTDTAERWGALTLAIKAIQIGRDYSTFRGEVKYELPITTSSRGLRSVFYLERRVGHDMHHKIRFFGSETVAGYRYHSSGFIGEINFKLATESPFQSAADPGSLGPTTVTGARR